MSVIQASEILKTYDLLDCKNDHEKDDPVNGSME